MWYRKHFTPREEWRGKRLFLHFEAIMGKSEVWVNGHCLARHYGGYLPVVVDISPAVEYGGDNVIAVRADNSDDPTFPPGKPQDALDFAYFGGIYRDCWLIAHNRVFITDPNYEDQEAGGRALRLLRRRVGGLGQGADGCTRAQPFGPVVPGTGRL